VRRLFRAALVGAVGVAVAACGGATSSETAPSQAESGDQPTAAASTTAGSELETRKVGYGLSKRGSGADLPEYAWTVAIVRNTTDNISGINVSFAAYDAAGRVLGQSDTSAPVVRARATVATGTVVEIPRGSKIAKVTATASVLSNLSQKDQNPQSRFVATDVRFQPEEYTDGNVVGEVVSQYRDTVNQVYVGAVCYDTAGKIVGGGEHYIEQIGPGQRVAFQVDSLTVSTKPARCEAYPTLSGASTAPGR
jgi:hypothetical protein